MGATHSSSSFNEDNKIENNKEKSTVILNDDDQVTSQFLGLHIIDNHFAHKKSQEKPLLRRNTASTLSLDTLNTMGTCSSRQDLLSADVVHVEENIMVVKKGYNGEGNIPIRREFSFQSFFGPSPSGKPKKKKKCRSAQRRRAPLTLLWNATSTDKHFEVIDEALRLSKDLHGEEGLNALGFEYRLFRCPLHKVKGGEEEGRPMMTHDEGIVLSSPYNDSLTDSTEDVTESTSSLPSTRISPSTVSPCSSFSSLLPDESAGVQNEHVCKQCATRLCHTPTDSILTSKNRTKYIADGAMYDEISRLCQEYAQQVMMKEGNLAWITVCDDCKLGNPVKALVHADHPLLSATPEDASSNSSSETSPSTLLVLTGKGKVRAGIFSRQHLLTSSLESGTSIPLIREAVKRNMKVIILDPNARGDRKGMDTFERSVKALFENDQSGGGPVSVLSHSASGGQLVRYLRDLQGGEKGVNTTPNLLQRIQAIAFTDSTHNVQWTKMNPALHKLLQSTKSLYIRSHHVRCDFSSLQPESELAGKEVDKEYLDESWVHRFGSIRTIWAGTKEHSLCNWTGHDFIWDHFDHHN